MPQTRLNLKELPNELSISLNTNELSVDTDTLGGAALAQGGPAAKSWFLGETWLMMVRSWRTDG